jgi:hypothetical protein
MPAFFSRTDDEDEQGLALYGVVGRLDRPEPEVALRAGAYGHWLPLRWTNVYAGEPPALRDRVASPTRRSGSGDGDDHRPAADVDAAAAGDGATAGQAVCVAVLSRLAARQRVGFRPWLPRPLRRDDR